MHIEPGVVTGAKLALSVVTAVGSVGLIGKMAWDSIRHDGGLTALLTRSVIVTGGTLGMFEILPHFPVGVSEVHFILGSTVLLIFGGGAAAIGLAFGLLLQALFFSPTDLPQFGMNLTTLIVPLFAVSMLARKLIPARTAYADVGYQQAFALSTVYQGAIVAWVGFWSFYGMGMEATSAVLTFGAAYMMVVLIEPLADLAALAIAKSIGGKYAGLVFTNRIAASAA